jgi:hypothetical protein
MQITRRGALVLLGAGRPLIGNSTALEASLVKRHDEAVERSLRLQITDPASRGYGNLPHLGQDHQDLGIYAARSAAGLLETFMAAYLYPESRYAGDSLLVDRMKLAAQYLHRVQHENGRSTTSTPTLIPRRIPLSRSGRRRRRPA